MNVSEWSPGRSTIQGDENKKKIMKSSLFDDNPTQNTPPRPTNPSASPPKVYKQENSYNSNPNMGFTQNKKISENFPTIQGIVHNSNIPTLSVFPEVSVDSSKLLGNFEIQLKPRTSLKNMTRKLTFQPSNQMKVMRDNLHQEMAQFSMRMHNLYNNDSLNIKQYNLPKDPVPLLPKPKPILTEPTMVSSLEIERQNITRNSANNLSSSINIDNKPGFSTLSEFIMPDGSKFD